MKSLDLILSDSDLKRLQRSRACHFHVPGLGLLPFYPGDFSPSEMRSLNAGKTIEIIIANVPITVSHPLPLSA
jgi:hypothetical protein